MKRLAVVVLLAALTACGGGAKHQLRATVETTACDVAATDVQVTDTDGKIVGTSRTTKGPDLAGICTAYFTVEDLPDSETYRVQVGQHDPASFTKADLEQKAWTVNIDLG